MERLRLISIILVSVALNASAQILLRWSARSGLPAGEWSVGTIMSVGLRPGIVGGLVCYALSILVWIWVLSRAQVSYAYPFLGLGFVVVSLAGCSVLGEALTLHRLAGTLLVSAGVLVLATS